uniref:papilin isoform X4 n=1 Tax=Lonchura striata TaxID=40157 RepID=UPI000B4DC8C9|nr:papilin isoform X4 [Lonchura striata domestica]XP_021389234.1 papilin isoform X4 [Lonchura striata domestica]XP_021389235.1 papilin isoform X4 [Lonchura striata domestica]XP_021389236.1 papilin isoform X4 [Lonchura striata domestica]XP_021389237.1 papilin isoform X4 [Lonchura striata domestica]
MSGGAGVNGANAVGAVAVESVFGNDAAIPKEGPSSCVGPTRSYRSCNIQNCPEGSRDFRAEQCAEFDGTEFQGKKYKWLPYYGAPNKCELNCIPKGENFYYRHKEAVVDGTTCEPGKRDICVEGVCQAVGCDNMLESAKKEDKCLQCGGDGSTCYGVKGTFDVASLPKGYNQIFIIPVGATNIQIKEVKPSRNFLAVKNVRGEYYLNGHWTIDFSRALQVASTVLHYDRGSEGDVAPELLHARGPTTEPLVIELISQEPNTGVQYEYYLPLQGQALGYSWSYGSWSECSSECGGGFQSRLVFCTIDNEIYPDYMCRNKPQPDNNRTCGHQPCPQTKRWKTGEWGSCSATCGGGTQTRSVYCVAFDGQSLQGVVDDAECMAFAQQPRRSQPCNVRQCASWSTGPWSQCSASCGEGVQTRTVTCRTQQGSQAQDFACLMEPKPSATQPCLKENCIQEIGWHVGDWGLCSKSCDSGIRTRQVICADGDSKFYSPETCKAIQPQKPATLGSCNTQPCYLPQQVPSMQDTMGYNITRQSLLTRYNPNSPAPVLSPDSDDGRMLPGNTMIHSASGNQHIPSTKDHSINLFAVHWESQSRSPGSHRLSFSQDHPAGTGSQDCHQSPHGCCPDGRTAASGPQGRGCPFSTCHQNRYGCCPDGVSAAQGPNNIGCPQYSNIRTRQNHPTVTTPAASQALSQQHPSGECRGSMYGCCFDNVASAKGPRGEGCLNRPNYPYPVMCLLPSAHGPCANWTTRWYFVGVVGRCNRFWYGGCHGNKNSFASEEECMRVCHSSVGVSQLELQPSPGTEALQHQQTGSSSYTGRAQDQQQSPTRETASHIQEGRTYGASLPKQDSHSWRRDVLPETLPRTDVLESQRWDTQRSRLDSLGHLHSWETAMPGPSDRQSSSGQQVLPWEGKQWREAFGADVSVTEGFGHQESADLFPAQALQRTILEESKPSLVTAAVGQNIQLVCKTGVSPFSRVEWMKNSQPIFSDRHTYQSDSSLVISHVQPEDAGTYTCLTSDGKMESRQIQLQITEYQSSVLAEGERGRVLQEANQQRRGLSRGRQLVQAAGSSVRQQLTYRLKMDKSEPTVVEANVGERVRLPCTVEASPALTIEWRKDGQPLSSPRHRQQSDGALVISRVSSEDIGFFTCMASNGRDRDQRQVLLRPLGELRITGLLPSITVPEGGTAQLHCTVIGNNVNIRWSRNGVPMRGDGHHIHLSQDGSLTISNVQEADEGSYTCSAYSSSSSVSASSEVKVLRSRPSTTVSHIVDLSRECVDQPHLANCDLILQAQLCGNEYYSSFCCASCARHRSQGSPPHPRG